MLAIGKQIALMKYSAAESMCGALPSSDCAATLKKFIRFQEKYYTPGVKRASLMKLSLDDVLSSSSKGSADDADANFASLTVQCTEAQLAFAQYWRRTFSGVSDYTKLNLDIPSVAPIESAASLSSVHEGTTDFFKLVMIHQDTATLLITVLFNALRSMRQKDAVQSCVHVKCCLAVAENYCDELQKLAGVAQPVARVAKWQDQEKLIRCEFVRSLCRMMWGVWGRITLVFSGIVLGVPIGISTDALLEDQPQRIENTSAAGSQDGGGTRESSASNSRSTTAKSPNKSSSGPFNRLRSLLTFNSPSSAQPEEPSSIWTEQIKPLLCGNGCSVLAEAFSDALRVYQRSSVVILYDATQHHSMMDDAGTLNERSDSKNGASHIFWQNCRFVPLPSQHGESSSISDIDKWAVACSLPGDLPVGIRQLVAIVALLASGMNGEVNEAAEHQKCHVYFVRRIPSENLYFALIVTVSEDSAVHCKTALQSSAFEKLRQLCTIWTLPEQCRSVAALCC